MIYSSNHNTHGRLGNHIMRLMGMIGLAKRYNTTYAIPSWKYAKHFDSEIPQTDRYRHDQFIKEPHYHYTPKFWDTIDFNRNIDLKAWLQSPKYWELDEQGCRDTLKFKDDFIQGLRQKYSTAFEKPVIAISVRRGDFVFNSNYYQLPIRYYIGALLTHFPDFRHRNILIFSDDIKYCKIHFECLENAYFAEGSDIEQLALMTLCDDFIVSNSTFSVCGAYLANKGIVVRPFKNLDGELSKTHDEKDFWPERWIVFEHENYRIPLSDVTFTLPLSYDHNDRKQNLELSICLLQQTFDTNIIIMEHGGNKFEYMKQWVRYDRFEGKEFHRTKMLNDMALMSETSIVVNYDADNPLAPMQIIEAAQKIRQGTDMVYPFDGRSARVPRKYFTVVEKYLDMGVLQDQYKGMDKYNSVGHAIFFNKQSFIEGGMENEKMISWGPEDAERYERFKKLGFKIERIKGAAYHLDHYVGKDSSSVNPYYKANWEELEKERSMTEFELRNYVSTWEWAHPYTDAYYKSIIDESVMSRDEVFKVLKEETYTETFFPTLGWVRNRIEFKSVVDIGCGCGEWGKDIEKFGVERYVGVDHNIGEKRLLINEYYDCDLRDVATVTGIADSFANRFDLCLCLEVAEHLPEEVAPDLVRFLCSLSDNVLFSAAIPYQPGVGHINCQWQTWWERLFNDNGYYSSEQPIKDLLINNPNVCDWYKQNIVLYSKHFAGKAEDYVLPKMFENIISSLKQTA
jgi:SAM-dependent methyltransferase